MSKENPTFIQVEKTEIEFDFQKEINEKLKDVQSALQAQKRVAHDALHIYVKERGTDLSTQEIEQNIRLNFFDTHKQEKRENASTYRSSTEWQEGRDIAAKLCRIRESHAAGSYYLIDIINFIENDLLTVLDIGIIQASMREEIGIKGLFEIVHGEKQFFPLDQGPSIWLELAHARRRSEDHQRIFYATCTVLSIIAAKYVHESLSALAIIWAISCIFLRKMNDDLRSHHSKFIDKRVREIANNCEQIRIPEEAREFTNYLMKINKAKLKAGKSKEQGIEEEALEIAKKANEYFKENEETILTPISEKSKAAIWKALRPQLEFYESEQDLEIEALKEVGSGRIYIEASSAEQTPIGEVRGDTITRAELEFDAEEEAAIEDNNNEGAKAMKKS